MKKDRQKRREGTPSPGAGPNGAGGPRTTDRNLTDEVAELLRQPAWRRFLHTHMLPGSIYRELVSTVFGKDSEAARTAETFVADFVERFRPRDPVEELLVSQMLWTHARMAKLSLSALRQEHVKWAQLMHDGADRAANAFRRQLLALAEYRRPPGGNRSFTAIGQANIANQQVVQNGGNTENPREQKTSNEQGSGHGEAKGLPADPGGTGVAPGQRPAGSAVGAEHRPADGRG